ncbi:MAG: serine esterase [Myxococcales bacterium FL481]|nr:MAG: serine esterase [Myxococcales bacterium FL481]
MKTRALRSQFIPASPVGAPRRLLVVLHGRGDSSDGFAWLPAALALPGVDYLLVDAPDPYLSGYSWYDLPPHQGPGVERSRGRLFELFDEIAAAGYQPAHIGLFGFSQGCLMTLDFGGRCTRALAAYVGVSGYCWRPRQLLTELTVQARRPAWLLTHGHHDEVLDFATTSSQVDQLVAGGLPVQFRAYEKGHTIDPVAELPDLRDFLAERLVV